MFVFGRWAEFPLRPSAHLAVLFRVRDRNPSLLRSGYGLQAPLHAICPSFRSLCAIGPQASDTLLLSSFSGIHASIFHFSCAQRYAFFIRVPQKFLTKVILFQLFRYFFAPARGTRCFTRGGFRSKKTLKNDQTYPFGACFALPLRGT